MAGFGVYVNGVGPGDRRYRSAAEAYFLDADMYRKGTVPASKFKRALRLMFQDIPFTEDMLNALCMAYAASPSAKQIGPGSQLLVRSGRTCHAIGRQRTARHRPYPRRRSRPRP